MGRERESIWAFATEMGCVPSLATTEAAEILRLGAEGRGEEAAAIIRERAVGEREPEEALKAAYLRTDEFSEDGEDALNDLREERELSRYDEEA